MKFEQKFIDQVLDSTWPMIKSTSCWTGAGNIAVLNHLMMMANI